ncbi:MAG: PKD domain-containing protein [Gemmatimonadaceae bacterium]|nr:PKD domain-containing protein [Gemmatimonadaceae bacterium]
MRVRHEQSRYRAVVACTLGVFLSFSCGGDANAPTTGVLASPDGLVADAVGTQSVRISWARVAGPTVTGYALQRRENLEGAFKTIAPNVPNAGTRITYFDNSVVPDRYYGYRVMALGALGAQSPPSTVGGTKTPDRPSLVVSVVTHAPNDASADPDGYSVQLLGPRDTLSASLAVNGERRFNDLRAGQYVVLLRGLAVNCGFSVGDSVKTTTIVDQGVQTQSKLFYDVSCRDPQKGSIVVRYEQSGDTTDANGVRLTVTGLLTEPDPVDTARVFFRTQTITSRIESLRYDNLRRGTYEITLDDISPVCTVAGARKRSVQVKSLSIDTIRYVAECARPISEDTTGKPYILEHRWSAATAPTGSKVSLTMSLNLSANAAAQVSGVQAGVVYSSVVLRYDSARVSEFDILTSNGRTPGLVNFAAANTDGTGRSGTITIGRVWFTVIGATGTSTRTGTTLVTVSAPDLSELKSQTRIREATLTVGTVSGSSNQGPVARANGPYIGSAGMPVTFSSTQSTDPDGTIASYRWDFGDGTNSALPSPAKVYAAAGSYVATLTVTDDKGASARDEARVTITASAGGGANQPPIARISAPTSAPAATVVTLSGTQSTDADGTIASYAWTFGDGSGAAGPTVTKSFSTAGTYNVVLTVTDDKGATGSAQHTVTITSAGGGGSGDMPFTWAGTFGVVDAVTKFVDLTVTLDLSANIVETPGGEQLQSYIVDSLKWDPVLLQMVAFNFGAGQAQSVNQSDVSRGKVVFSGSTLAAQNAGVLTIARLRFRVVGRAGARAAILTALGPLIGTPATGSYNYRPKVEVRDGVLLVP